MADGHIDSSKKTSPDTLPMRKDLEEGALVHEPAQDINKTFGGRILHFLRSTL